LFPGPHSTLHGVVFAILCLGSAVYRRRGAALRPGRAIVSASRSRRIDPTPMHHALVHAHVGLLQPIYKRFLLGSDLRGKRRSEPFVEHQQLVDRH